MDYFVRPDLRINQRARYKSNGEFIEGLHIYPDKECKCEILKLVQNRLNSNMNILNRIKNNKLGALLFISELVIHWNIWLIYQILNIKIVLYVLKEH